MRNLIKIKILIKILCMIVIFLSKFCLIGGQKIERFKILRLNGSTELILSKSFRNSFSIINFKSHSLINCASECSVKMNCLILAFCKRQNYCELFSSQNNVYSELMSQKDSQVFRKFDVNNQDLTSTFATTESTNNIVSSNSISEYKNCSDNLSYFSITHNGCVKCRDGWLGYKNVCYKGFTDTKNWQNFVDFCASLNSSLIIADNDEKFKFFQGVSKSLTLKNNNERTWVYARHDVINEFKWMNSKPINISNIMQSTTSYTGCFAYYTTPNSYLSVNLCSSKSNGICEYDY